MENFFKMNKYNVKKKLFVVSAICFVVCMTVLPQKAQAQSILHFWNAMPDSILPSLDSNKRADLMDYANMGVRAEVKNLLNEKVTLDTLTSDFTKITLSEGHTMQIKRLPVENEDSVFCVVRTFGTDNPESTINIYHADWSKRSKIEFDPQQITEQIVSKENINQEKMNLDKYVPVIAAYLDAHSDEMTLKVSYLLLSKEEKQLLKDKEMQLNVKWNGKIFN